MAELKLESKISKIYELENQFKNDLKDQQTLKEQYDILVEIIKSSKKRKKIPNEFLKGIEDYSTQCEKVIKNITNRLGYIELLLELHKNEPEIADKYVTLVFEVLGIGNTEDPVIEENSEEKEDKNEEKSE